MSCETCEIFSKRNCEICYNESKVVIEHEHEEEDEVDENIN